MDIGTRWNLNGCTDAAFVVQAIALVERERPGLSGPIIALQEYGPGIVAMRDGNRNFVVVFDQLRWGDRDKRAQVPAVLTGKSSPICTITFADSRENFDDHFAHAKNAISPKKTGVRWHMKRTDPILASS